jgi:protocatechuate 3,4-dioxygenase beta subunit
MNKLLILLPLMFLAQLAAADPDKIYKNQFNTCPETKETMNNYEPEVFETSNNLLRKTGANPVFCGEKVLLKGKVLDKKCVPISDAKVYLWQVGCDGKYPYKPLRKLASEDKMNTTSGSTFTGSGIATTDNNGEFWFVTIIPPKSHRGHNNINIRVEHRDLGELQTQISPTPGDNGEYDFTIVLHEKNKFRRY